MGSHNGARWWARSRGQGAGPSRQPVALVHAGDLDRPHCDERRRRLAATVVRDGLARAEERYLVAPGASLGTWFARVHETIAVASRVTLARSAEGRLPGECDVASELAGLYADICAEAIRGAAQLLEGESPRRARDEALDHVSAVRVRLVDLTWERLLELLVCLNAQLEPLANGLREGDLPMGEPTDCDLVMERLVAVAEGAFGAVCVLS